MHSCFHMPFDAVKQMQHPVVPMFRLCLAALRLVAMTLLCTYTKLAVSTHVPKALEMDFSGEKVLPCTCLNCHELESTMLAIQAASSLSSVMHKHRQGPGP